MRLSWASANLWLMWLNGTLLFWAFGAIALLASVSFDRLTPAIGISLAVVLVSYFLDVLGSLWPDAKWLQPYSLFHYVDAKADLAGLPHTGGLRDARRSSSPSPSGPPSSSSRAATSPLRPDPAA